MDWKLDDLFTDFWTSGRNADDRISASTSQIIPCAPSQREDLQLTQMFSNQFNQPTLNMTQNNDSATNHYISQKPVTDHAVTSTRFAVSATDVHGVDSCNWSDVKLPSECDFSKDQSSDRSRHCSYHLNNVRKPLHGQVQTVSLNSANCALRDLDSLSSVNRTGLPGISEFEGFPSALTVTCISQTVQPSQSCKFSGGFKVPLKKMLTTKPNLIERACSPPSSTIEQKTADYSNPLVSSESRDFSPYSQSQPPSLFKTPDSRILLSRQGPEFTYSVIPSSCNTVQSQNARYTAGNDLPLVINGKTPGGSDRGPMSLRPVSEIPAPYSSIFSYPYFNAVQSKVIDDALYKDQALVVSAPTGSGKTVLFELAIIRLLIIYKHMSRSLSELKVVYMAPIKALCSERFEDWTSRFGTLGLRCLELTGDSDIDDYFALQDIQIILTTPEKWDHMTRRWRDNKSLVQQTQLFLIDEVHMLSDPNRGATLEAVVSRMKTVQSALFHNSKTSEGQKQHIRFVAASATIPNIEDIAEWLSCDESSPAIFHKIDESYRPVRLRKVVLGFPCSDQTSDFKFDMSLNYKLANVVNTYSEKQPTLIFCATRKSTVQAANVLARDIRFEINAALKQRLRRLSEVLKDSKLRELVMAGIGYHHAGMDTHDRKIIEVTFARGDMAVLVATSTLAMGVNLPAYLVVIKSTKQYNMGGFQEYSETHILQMIGRAGRPQFQTSATAVIMTKSSTKAKYEALLNGTQLMESSLHENLIEHLNAEIVLDTIRDVSVALNWIKSTYLYIRINKNPQYYGNAKGLTAGQVENKLQELCLKSVSELASIQLVEMDDDCFTIKPTDTGRLMARYCLSFETMNNFHKMKGTENLSETLSVISESREFKDIKLRMNEKRILNSLNVDKHRLKWYYGNEKQRKMAHLGCLPLHEFSLQQDLTKITRLSLRISKCLVEVLWNRDNFVALLSAITLNKCLHAKIWENSMFISRQLSGIGVALATAFVNVGLDTFQKIADRNPRDLELIINRQPPFGNQICDAIAHLPKYDLSIKQTGQFLPRTAELSISVRLLNFENISEKATLGIKHTCYLLVGDLRNKIVFKAKICDAQLIETEWLRRIDVKRTAAAAQTLSIHLISQDCVGIDVHSSFVPIFTEPPLKPVATPGISSMPAINVTPKRTTEKKALKWKSATASAKVAAVKTACSHNCHDKSMCLHDCCKLDLSEKSRYWTPTIKNLPTMAGYKRLKLQSSLQDFAYRCSTVKMPRQSASPKQLESDGARHKLLASVPVTQRASLSMPISTPLIKKRTSNSLMKESVATPRISSSTPLAAAVSPILQCSSMNENWESMNMFYMLSNPTPVCNFSADNVNDECFDSSSARPSLDDCYSPEDFQGLSKDQWLDRHVMSMSELPNKTDEEKDDDLGDDDELPDLPAISTPPHNRKNTTDGKTIKLNVERRTTHRPVVPAKKSKCNMESDKTHDSSRDWSPACHFENDYNDDDNQLDFEDMSDGVMIMPRASSPKNENLLNDNEIRSNSSVSRAQPVELQTNHNLAAVQEQNWAW